MDKDLAFYHLDGSGQLAHLDSILAIEELGTAEGIILFDSAPPEDKYQVIEFMKRHGAE